MPALSSTMAEGKIVSWLKEVGDKVDAGDTLMVVESDKADMDVESFEEGYLAKIITEEGESATVGAAVCILVETEGEIAAVDSAPAPASAEAAPPPPAAAPPAVSGGVESIPMAMPALSSTMTEGKIVSWLVSVGDKVEAGDAVMVVESDKADMDVESFEDGFIAAILTEEGESASVGATVALLAASEADIEAVAAQGLGGAPAPPSAPAPAAPPPAASSSSSSSSSVAAADLPIVNTGRVVASGYAKKVAAESGVDLRTVAGSGPGGRVISADVSSSPPSGGASYVPAAGVVAATPTARVLAKKSKVDLASVAGTGNFGRVTEDDVLVHLGKPPKQAYNALPPPPAPLAAPASPAPPAAAAAPSPATKAAAPLPAAAAAAAAPSGVVPMGGMMKAVAKNMEATLAVPIFRVSRAIETDKFDVLAKTLKPKGVSVSALLAKACAMVLEKHPIVNAAYDASGAIKYNEDINVAMAVALDGGLITPTIRNCNNLDVYSVGREWAGLVQKAKAKQLTPPEYTTGTFFISNLGMFGVQQFDAILPVGAGSILAIAASLPKVKQMPNGSFGVVKEMTVTMTCDHRHIYGADAAGFLKDLAYLIENEPESMMFN